jgi:hypothetical protein
MQPKTVMPLQTKQPVASPVYRPQPKPHIVQQKTATPSQLRTSPVAPPVYRPQPVPKVLQPKMRDAHDSVNQSKRVPATPAVYRPQPLPKVLQTKAAGGQQSHTSQTPRRPVAPPVYRPEPGKIVQPKMAAAAQALKSPKAPPVWRPQPVPKVLQAKGSHINANAPGQHNRALAQGRQFPVQQPSHALAQRPGRPAMPKSSSSIQMKWDSSQLAAQTTSSSLKEALNIFTSGVKYTGGPGVAMYRLAQWEAGKLDVEFVEHNANSGAAGSTCLLYKESNQPVIGLLDGIVYMDRKIIERARKEGFKIRIKINMGAKLNATTGGVINTLVHEYGVHAAEYYEYIRDILQTEDHDVAHRAALKLYEEEGVGKEPIKKEHSQLFSSFGIFDEHSVETRLGEAQHKQLARGGSDYYKALSGQISNTELNTTYHKSWYKHHKEFLDTQAEDQHGHDLAYNPKKMFDTLINMSGLGNMDDLSESSNALLEASKLWKQSI